MNLVLAQNIGLPFIPGWLELRPFIADVVLILTIVAVLLTPFFTAGRSNVATGLVSLVGLAIAFISQVAVGAGEGVVGEHFRGILVADQFAHLWKLILLLFVIGVILMWFTTVAQGMHEGDGPEFFALLLSATLGMSLMASTHNLLMLFLAVEMASLPSYVLAGFRKTHRVGAEASLKYVLFGAATSSVMVYGLSYLYGLYGSLNVAEIATAMAKTGSMGIGGAALLAVAIFGLIVGIGFKISAVPFHFWCPDVFEGASIDVTTFLSVASKGAALVLLLRVLTLLANGMGYQGHAGGVSLNAIAITIGVLGAITCTVGNTGALVQNNIKRLLAYSSIAHAGYMLCALSLLVKHKANLATGHGGAGDGAGTIEVSAAQAILLYLAVYLFMNLGAFTVAALVYRQTGSEDIRDYAALGRRAPVAAACMTACMFSLIGLPPFAGFAAKFNLMQVLGANGGWWWLLVAVIGVNTIVSLYYYVRVVKTMYLNPSDAPDISVNPLGLGLAVACAAALLLMFIGYGPIDRLTTSYGRIYTSQTAPAAPAGAATRPAQTAMAPQH
ncbi:MAG: NADH-quinone oxidoreductase subunit [Phycisphaerales bacterium]|jgi:NADH-quinone oxidoreductase subunit N|nr:NADH-quinone oxidoreductase subunit [Phycisphaerales bacterium]